MKSSSTNDAAPSTTVARKGITKSSGLQIFIPGIFNELLDSSISDDTSTFLVYHCFSV